MPQCLSNPVRCLEVLNSPCDGRYHCYGKSCNDVNRCTCTHEIYDRYCSPTCGMNDYNCVLNFYKIYGEIGTWFLHKFEGKYYIFIGITGILTNATLWMICES